MPAVFNQKLEHAPGSTQVMTLSTSPPTIEDELDQVSVGTSYPVAVTDSKFFLRNDRNRPNVGFGSVSVLVGPRTITINNLQVMRDKDTGVFSVRVPRKESADKRKGASWSTVGKILVEMGVSSDLPDWLTDVSVIVPGVEVDLEDLSKPWISYWPDVTGGLTDDVVRFGSTICSQCDTCANLCPHDPVKFSALGAKLTTLSKQIEAVGLMMKSRQLALATDEEELVDPITGEVIENLDTYLPNLIEAREKTEFDIANALFTCKVSKVVAVTADGFADCQSYKVNPAVVVQADDKVSQSIKAVAEAIAESDYSSTDEIPF